MADTTTTEDPRLLWQQRVEGFAAELFNEEWIGRVAFTRDRDLRAHRIALTYHYFARELDRRINADQSVWSRLERNETPRIVNANWFNFATWATITVNRDLSLRRIPAGPKWVGQGAFRRTLTPTLLQLRAADNQRVSRALSWGQRLVFLGTTLTFLEYVKGSREGFSTVGQCRHDHAYELIENWSKWDGKPTLDRGHLDVVWSAFGDYARAVAAADKLRALLPSGPPAVRSYQAPEFRHLRALMARSIFLANLKITAVEQDVVDQPVRAVIESVPSRLAEAAVERMAGWGERYLDIPRVLTGLELPEELRPWSRAATEAWARLMTSEVLVMMLPNETLRLGRDLPPRCSGEPLFPPDLSDLTSLPGAKVPEVPDGDIVKQLRDLVSVFDRSRGDGKGSGARDWRVYDDRMNWAVNMLRSRQQDLTLYWPPYCEEDQERIYNGDLPHQFGDPTEHEVDAPFVDRTWLTDDQTWPVGGNDR